MISIKTLAKTALIVAIAGASVTTAFASHSWNNYHWARTTSSVTLPTLDSTVANSNANWPGLLATAAAQWSASSKIDLSVSAYANDSRSRKRCSAVSGKIRVCNASYGKNGWLGLASINLDSNGHISQGTAKMNDSYSSTWTSDPNEAAHVMCQEVGHDFGLGHTSEDGSSQGTCMDYSSSPSSTAPNQHDYDQLVSIYGHTDSYSSTKFSAARITSAQSTMVGDVPRGTLVRKGHFSELYVAPDGKGGLWITHVTLAPGFEHMSTQ